MHTALSLSLCDLIEKYKWDTGSKQTHYTSPYTLNVIKEHIYIFLILNVLLQFCFFSLERLSLAFTAYMQPINFIQNVLAKYSAHVRHTNRYCLLSASILQKLTVCITGVIIYLFFDLIFCCHSLNSIEI